MWFEHLQLVEDVLLHAGVGSGSEGHHGHRAELPAQHVQPLVVLAEVVAPLVDKQNLSATEQSAPMEPFGVPENKRRFGFTWLTQWASSMTKRAKSFLS